MQIALELKKSPEEIEEMSEYWINRLWVYLVARGKATKKTKKPGRS